MFSNSQSVSQVSPYGVHHGLWDFASFSVLSLMFNEKESKSKFFNPGKEELFGVLLLLGGADL